MRKGVNYLKKNPQLTIYLLVSWWTCSILVKACLILSTHFCIVYRYQIFGSIFVKLKFEVFFKEGENILFFKFLNFFVFSLVTGNLIATFSLLFTFLFQISIWIEIMSTMEHRFFFVAPLLHRTVFRFCDFFILFFK